MSRSPSDIKNRQEVKTSDMTGSCVTNGTVGTPTHSRTPYEARSLVNSPTAMSSPRTRTGTEDMDKFSHEIGNCCFCGEECNPCSQCCGRCARSSISWFNFEPYYTDTRGQLLGKATVYDKTEEKNWKTGFSGIIVYKGKNMTESEFRTFIQNEDKDEECPYNYSNCSLRLLVKWAGASVNI